MTDRVTLTVDVPQAALRIDPPRPIMVSQHTVTAVLGLKRRAFLEAVLEFRAGGGQVLSFGRTRLVELEQFLEWLRSRTHNESHGSGLPELASELGLRVVGGQS